LFSPDLKPFFAEEHDDPAAVREWMTAWVLDQFIHVESALFLQLLLIDSSNKSMVEIIK
jgi:hypothetical protein